MQNVKNRQGKYYTSERGDMTMNKRIMPHVIVGVLVGIVTLTSFTAQAQDVYSEQFQTIQSIELFELVTNEEGSEVEVLVQNQKAPDFFDQFSKEQKVTKVNAGDIIMITKQLIALGKEIYKIIEAGRPVTNINSVPVEILPRDEQGNTITAMELHGWRAPVVRKYRVATKNYLGMRPVSFEFMLIFSHGGQNQGKGMYITGAQIKPSSVDVKWGYRLDADFKVLSIMNQGSYEDPIAGAVLSIDYKVSTILQSQMHNKTFYINGLGEVTAY